MKKPDASCNSALLLDLYESMMRIRICEESLIDPILRGDILTPCHLYTGQEAIAAGMCAALEKKDYVFGNHRSHGHFLAKGGSMRELVAEIYCKEGGCAKGRGGSMHVAYPAVGMLGSAPIVAGTISLALGAALASSIRHDGRIAVSFFGDGAAGEGVLYEAMNFAALRMLPIIFVCENNFYSTHLPVLECRPRETIFEIAEPFGIKTNRTDGNDVMAVLDAVHEAAGLCRSGAGPAFLEFVTYRLRGHVGPDDNIQGQHTDIRPKAELESWRLRDPITRFEEYLVNRSVASFEDLVSVKERIRLEVEDAHRFAEKSAWPHQKELARYVFAKKS